MDQVLLIIPKAALTAIDGARSDFCNMLYSTGFYLRTNVIYFSHYDLPSCNLFSNPRMYADGTTRTSSVEDPYILEHKTNCDINLIQSWLDRVTLDRVNRHKYLGVHIDEFLNFTSKRILAGLES